MKEIKLEFWIFINNILLTINKFILKLIEKINKKEKEIFKDLYGYYP